ncbi:MAG: 6,7-dimethyl-8-ribityllumazine synthase [Cyclobacteriaceae bacterium]
MAGPLKSVTGKKNIRPKGKAGIVVARWNEEITGALLTGAREGLIRSGYHEKDILITYVPGSFELPLAAQRLAVKKDISGVICIGCLIKGDTPHFDYISQATAQGIMDVGLKTSKPVIFGVLTTNTLQQAIDRAGGKLGNKGEEAAASLIEMLS